jgi:hypothetical protein
MKSPRGIHALPTAAHSASPAIDKSDTKTIIKPTSSWDSVFPAKTNNKPITMSAGTIHHLSLISFPAPAQHQLSTFRITDKPAISMKISKRG